MGFGPPKDLVALFSEAIVIPVADHRPCGNGSPAELVMIMESGGRGIEPPASRIAVPQTASDCADRTGSGPGSTCGDPLDTRKMYGRMYT